MPAVPKEPKTKTASKQTGTLNRLASLFGRSTSSTLRALQPKKVNKTSISSPSLQSSTSGQAQPTHLAPSSHAVAGTNIHSTNHIASTSPRNAPNAPSPNPSSSNGTGVSRPSARTPGACDSTGGSLAKTAPQAPHIAPSSKPPAHSTMMHASASTPLSSSSFSRSSTVRRGAESKSASTNRLPVDTARARVQTNTSATARLQRAPGDTQLYTPAATSSRAAHSVVKPTASSSRNGKAAKPAFSVQRTPASKPVPPPHEHRLATHPYQRRRSREVSIQPKSSSVTTAASVRKTLPSASATLRTSKTFSTADVSGPAVHPKPSASGAGDLQDTRPSVSSTRSVRVNAASRRQSAVRPTKSSTSSSSAATAATSEHSPQWSLSSLSSTTSVSVDPASHKLPLARQAVAASSTLQSALADPPPAFSRIPAALDPPSATLSRSKRSSQLVEQALATAPADDVMQVDDDAAAVSLEERMSTCTPVPSSSPSPLHAANSPVTWPSATEIFETDSPEPESRSSAPSYTLSVFIPTGELDIPGTTVLNDSVVSEPTSARAPAAKRGRGKMLRRNGLSSSTAVETTSSAASITLATLEAAGMISSASDSSSVMHNVSHIQSLAAEDDTVTVNDEDTVIVQSQARAPSPARADETARVSRASPNAVTEDHMPMDVDMDVAEAAVEGLRLSSPSSDSSSREDSPHDAEAVVGRAQRVWRKGEVEGESRLPSPSSDSSGSDSRETSPYEAEAVVVRVDKVQVQVVPERRDLSDLVSAIEGPDILNLDIPNAAAHSLHARVAHFTQANGSMQAVAMAEQLPIIVGHHVQNLTVRQLLNKDGHPMHMVFVGSWTDGKALFAYADDAGHFRVFVKCDVMLFFRLRDSPSFLLAREISLDDTMNEQLLEALRIRHALKAVVLRIVITGLDDAWVFRVKRLIFTLPHLESVIVTTRVECKGWEVVSSPTRLQLSAHKILHFLQHAVQYHGKPLIDVDRERIDLVHEDECVEALEKLGRLLR